MGPLTPLEFWCAVYIGATAIPTLVGLLTIFHWVKPKPGIDQSNVINRIRLWWLALTRPGKFAEFFPWLLEDEWDNIND